MISRQFVSFIEGFVNDEDEKLELVKKFDSLGFFVFFDTKSELMFFAHAIGENYDDIRDAERRALEWIASTTWTLI